MRLRTANRTLGISWQAHLPPLHGAGIQQQQASGQRLADARNHLDGFHRLHRTDDADHGSHDAVAGAGGLLVVAVSVETLITGAGGITAVEHRYLAFHADHVIRRKHTANAKRDLPGLVSEVIEPLHFARKAQAQRIEAYKAFPLSDPLADQAIMAMYRHGVINLTRIADVLAAYEEPPHDWGDKTPWRLFNAATFALAGKVTENPTTTRMLHEVIEGVCHEVV